MVAQLELKAEAYIEPEPFIDKLAEARAYKLSAVNIAKAKATIIAEKKWYNN